LNVNYQQSNGGLLTTSNLITLNGAPIYECNGDRHEVWQTRIWNLT